MKEFNLKSGTKVIVESNKVNIIRNDGKSAMKELSAISGMVQYADYLLICASGLPTPNDFKISNVADIKQYPNCIVGKENELKEIYDYISELI